jgi:hypothetical protein
VGICSKCRRTRSDAFLRTTALCDGLKDREVTMARAPKGLKAHPSKWTLVFFTRVQRFDSLVEAEEALKKAEERGERAYIQPPLEAWRGKGHL